MKIGASPCLLGKRLRELRTLALNSSNNPWTFETSIEARMSDVSLAAAAAK